MNRMRINLILGVLLFPITNPKLQSKDYLYERCRAYKELVAIKGTSIGTLAEKSEKNRKYRDAVDELIQFLSYSCRSKIQSYDDLQMLCELYYPLLGMQRYIEQIQKKVKIPKGIKSDEKENTAPYYIEQMRRIALSLLTYRDGIMAIRTWNNREIEGQRDIFYSHHVFDKVEIWNVLNSYVSIDLFIALFIVESGLGEDALYGQKPYISLPDKLLVKVLRKGIAENHLHFNAGFDCEAVWLNKMNLWNCLQLREKLSPLQENQDIEAALFRLLCAIFFMESEMSPFIIWISKFRNGIFMPVIHVLYTGEKISFYDEELFKNIWDMLSEDVVRRRADYLLETFLSSKIELKTSSEFILLYYSCRYMKEYPWDTGFTRIFLQYIRIKNSFIQRTQQSNLIPGLRHFQKFFNQMNHEAIQAAGRERMMLDVFRAQSKIIGLKKLEIRITPDVKLEQLYNLDGQKLIDEIKTKLFKQLFDIFSLYQRYILEDIMGVQETEYLLKKKMDEYGYSYYQLVEKVLKKYKEKIDKLEIPVLGIVYHFIKTESTDNLSGYYCWRDIRHKNKSCSNHRFFLRERMALLGIAIEELRIEIPQINEYIVGIDAASDENAMEPWMFAMAYMYMRSKLIVRPIATQRMGHIKGYYNIQNIGFTYHVGEDYRHIVSGLRHIDEVIERFFYKPGDRLGHALALGVDIDRWIRETEVVAMPIQEYMENLLWIWGKGINGVLKLPIQLEMIEEKILFCAEKIYKNISGISVRLLYQAYEQKFSPSHRKLLMRLQEEEKIISETALDKLPIQKDIPNTYCKMINANCIEYRGLWTVERLVSTVYCPVFEERGNQVEMVPVKENELSLYQCLQEHLQKKVAQKGIYIEINPTSNMNVGNIKELLEHPIFRLSPLKQLERQEPRILVTINSDDPAIFNTNVENELAYVYYALDHAGCAKEDALQWIDKVRQNGMDGSFIARTKDCSTLLEEISRILDVLKKFC